MTLLLALAFAADEVRISGTVESSVGGPIRVELLRGEEGAPQLLVASVVLDEPGPFALTVKPHLGQVVLRAGADPDGDGIGAGDAQVVHSPALQIQDSPVTALTLSLVLPDAAD